MDLNSARMLNTASWSWSKIAAFLCFAVAGAILIVSLSLNGARAEMKGTGTDTQFTKPLQTRN